MKIHNIVIKFNKKVIQSRSGDALTLTASALQDTILKQYTYRSIVTDDMLLTQTRRNRVNFENLVGICYVQAINRLTLEEKKDLTQKMRACPGVEYAYVESPTVLPLSNNGIEQEAVPYERSRAPYFVSTQGYKDGLTSYHKGIDMEYAWSIGVTGKGVSCAIIDGGFNFTHISLRNENFINFDETDKNHEHGSACAGIIFGNDRGFGIKGLVHGADKCYGVSNAETSVEALIKILPELDEGDVISCSWGSDHYPMDHDYGFWEVAKEGTEGGVIICLSAGNSSINMDKDEDLEEYRNRPDNGVIRVGAGDRFDLSRKVFSNYGKLVHLQGWGEWVTTVGGNDFYDYIARMTFRTEENCKYTFNFFGTSSAAPIVASAAIAVQSWYKKETGKVLSPIEMRDLLIETGTSQKGETKHSIGPLPNVRKAIETLAQRLQLTDKQYH